MRATVDLAVCQGHGVCSMNAPEVYELSDDDLAMVIVDPVPAELEADAQLGAASCPEQAITLR
ncbi:ferredoxin [Asanoa siamensis]|uniref:Ferredoxin n=1 Tax=Asanoa siamensis TaxID=926357 RepID=A0ABQ4CLC0_9ACTN|nr:ferredoxin [Asanoa siamensis]GIF72089.1 ferredoxin [Asanoa siamensis]